MASRWAGQPPNTRLKKPYQGMARGGGPLPSSSLSTLQVLLEEVYLIFEQLLPFKGLGRSLHAAKVVKPPTVLYTGGDYGRELARKRSGTSDAQR